MAGSWSEYFRGQPGRELVALQDQQKKWDEIKKSHTWSE